MQNKFPIYPAGFRKNHRTQHALLKMTETLFMKDLFEIITSLFTPYY